MTIGVGILGFAHGHVGAYCRKWLVRPELGIKLLAGWDHDSGRLEKSTAEFGLSHETSSKALVARDDVDVVVIAAETALHAELVETAALAGKTIILQKPAALTMPEADRIVAAVAKSGVRFSMAWQMRTDPQNIKMRELIKDKVLGRVFMIRRRHCLGVCLDNNFATTWHVSPKWNRDIWADDSSHPTDFIYWLLGMPESVTAEIMSLHSNLMPNDNGISIFRYPDGPLAEVSCSFTNRAGENTTEIVCEHGTIVQNFGDGPSCAYQRSDNAIGLKWFSASEGKWIDSGIPSPSSHGERIAGLAVPLAEFMHGRRPPIATAAEGRDVLRMVLASYVSTRLGKRVKIDDKEIDRITGNI